MAPVRDMFAAVFFFAVVGFVVLLRFTPQPWRGIVDAGVVVGLSWGVVTILVYWTRAARGSELPVPAEVELGR